MMTGGEEIAGPATVTVGQTASEMALNGITNNFCEVYSYYLTDAFSASPATGYIQGGTGNFQIAIESSQDLVNWAQVVYYPTSSNQKEFYRMRITQ